MLNPTLVKDGPGGDATLLPAQYKDDEIRLALKKKPRTSSIYRENSGRAINDKQ
jgi:hypothetical protein